MLCEFTLLSPLRLPSYFVPALWHAKSADFIFLPPVVRKCPIQESRLPPDCLNPTSVWIVALFQTKDRGGITILLPFTFFLWLQLGNFYLLLLLSLMLLYWVKFLERTVNLLNLKLRISCEWDLSCRSLGLILLWRLTKCPPGSFLRCWRLLNGFSLPFCFTSWC